MYNQQDMEEAHKNPEVVTNINTKDWPKTLEMVEECIRRFLGVYGQPLSYELRDDFEPPAAASDPMHRANGTNYFTHDDDMIDCELILSGPTVFVSDPEAVGPFIDSLITYRELIWDKMVAMFQGSNSWMYMKPYKKNCDGRMGYNII